MVVVKRILGWLCFLSLLASLYFAGMAAYSYTAPFFNGAYVELYDYSRGEFTHALSNELSLRGVKERRNRHLLREHALQGPKPTVYKGLEGAISQFGIPVRQRSYPDQAAAIVVVDSGGWPLYSYPGGLSYELPQYIIPTQNSPGNDWESTFKVVSERELSTGTLDHPDISPIIDSTGKQVGTLAVLWKSDRARFAVIPDSTRVNLGIEPQVVAIVAAALLLLFYLLLVIWVAMDAAWRGMRPFAWGALVFLTNILGLIAYVIARLSPPSPCRNCGEMILAKYKRCPSCGISLLKKCPACRAKLKPGWQFCPSCSTTFGDLFAGNAVAKPKEKTSQIPKTSVPSAKQPELRVVVVDSSIGAPVASAQVNIQGPVRLDGITNLVGTFEANSLSEGDYTIVVNKSGYDSAFADTQVVADKLTESKIEMQMLPGGIRGRVRDVVSQKAVAHAYVYPDSSRLDVSTNTDEAGEFEMNNIPAGPYTIVVNADGFVSQTRLAEVLPGKQVTLDFTLEAAEEVPSEV